jgi:hypothetical protein
MPGLNKKRSFDLRHDTAGIDQQHQKWIVLAPVIISRPEKHLLEQEI